MTSMTPEEVFKILLGLPDAATGLYVSFVIEFFVSDRAHGFYHVSPDGWRTPYFMKDLWELPEKFLPVMKQNPDSRLILFSDVRGFAPEKYTQHLKRVLGPHAITEAMRGLIDLLEHPEFDAFLSADPGRIYVVTVEPLTVRLRKDLGQAMLSLIHRSRARRSMDEDADPPSFPP